MGRPTPSRTLRLGFQIVAVTVWSANAFAQHPLDYVPDLPYTAQFAQTYFETLANGTQVSRERRIVQMRDSQGRTRTESFPPSRCDDRNQPTSVNLYVPLQREFIQLFPGTKTARVMTFPGTGPIPTHGLNLNAIETTTENLPGQMVHGVYAIGTRTTQRMPSDDGPGPDVVDVQETWISPDLKIIVLSKHKSTAPGSDNSVWEIQKLDRGEPNAALFAIPKDYKIMTAAFDESQPDSASDALKQEVSSEPAIDASLEDRQAPKIPKIRNVFRPAIPHQTNDFRSPSDCQLHPPTSSLLTSCIQTT